MAGQARSTPRVSAADPLHQLIVHELPDALRTIVDDTYLVRGSVGQATWSETPWVAVFDLRVTDSAQHGHYPVFLFHRDGSGVYLSLIQAITDAQAARGVRKRDVLVADADRLRALIPAADLEAGTLHLAGESARTRDYEVASIAAEFMAVSEIPDDDVLTANVSRFLRLSDAVTEGVDVENLDETEGSPNASPLTGKERRRYAWHWRAEGRNGAIAKRAKELRGYGCEVCGRNYAEDFGEMGKRAVDVHHLTPFHLLGPETRDLNPLTDFAIVCASCHRMLHSQNPPLRPADLASAISR
jgi:5-methylcytosine-specific restriction enzyme A